MPFDPATFEAEVALKLIPTEQLPLVAQDALGAGFDGPHVLRMAILEPVAGWAIEQALPPMMEELGLHLIAPEQAALRLARQRAQRILDTGEDPWPSLPYFHRLMETAGYPEELIELGYSTTRTFSIPMTRKRNERAPEKPLKNCFPRSCGRRGKLRERPQGSRSRLG